MFYICFSVCVMVFTTHTAIMQRRWYVFSSVYLWVGVSVCLSVNAITLEPFEMSRWIFHGSKIRSKACTGLKMAAFRYTEVHGWWSTVCDVPVQLLCLFFSCVDQTSGVAKETADSVFPFFHAQTSELLEEASKHECDRADQRTVQEIWRSFWA